MPFLERLPKLRRPFHFWKEETHSSLPRLLKLENMCSIKKTKKQTNKTKQKNKSKTKKKKKKEKPDLQQGFRLTKHINIHLQTHPTSLIVCIK